MGRTGWSWRDLLSSALCNLGEPRRIPQRGAQSACSYRCRELGLISDATASRTYQRLRALDGQPGFAAEPVSGYPREQPVLLLSQAFDLAAQETGLSVRELAQELAWPLARVRELLGMPDSRPVLRLV
ncbi:hypothetical protein OHA45_00235 [Streptomyces lydicus]|uniref:hypothetical protein n=1 Tax=Streptomyces lydicus TaxID=47763 RepID=UPI002E3656F6|nr:hypothetical protein [Streptomyces lydicus]